MAFLHLIQGEPLVVGLGTRSNVQTYLLSIDSRELLFYYYLILIPVVVFEVGAILMS